MATKMGSNPKKAPMSKAGRSVPNMGAKKMPAAKAVGPYKPTSKAAARGLAAEDADKVIVTVAFKGDGELAWVDYEQGDYVTVPPVDFSKGEEICFDDPQWDIACLLSVTTYALLRFRKKDGSLVACYVKTPAWW